MAEPVCFVIAPIGAEGSDIRTHSDRVWRHIIKPGVEENGLTALRADHIPSPGVITHQVIQHVLEDKLVIADLTGWNPNVFYELAIRHMIRKPYVQMIQRGEKIPFDLSNVRTVDFDYTDPDSLPKDAETLTQQIAAALNCKAVDSPISTSFDLINLYDSGNPEKRALVELTEIVGEIRAAVARIEARVPDSDRYIRLSDVIPKPPATFKRSRSFGIHPPPNSSRPPSDAPE